MSNEIQPVFKTVDYVVAEGHGEISRLLADGYEPHGSPLLEVGEPGVYQAMVKKELISTEEYLNMMLEILKVLPPLQEKMQDIL